MGHGLLFGLRLRLNHMLGTVLALSLLLALAAGCSNSSLKYGDTLIPPAPYSSAAGVREGPSSLNSLNNFSNMNNLVRPAADMEYTLLDNTSPPVSVFADSKYLYLLEGKGDEIRVYDVENGSLVRKIGDSSLKSCSAFTVRDSNIYVFDKASGKVLIFSSGGSLLTSYDTGLKGADVEKLLAAKERRIVLQYADRRGSGSRLAMMVMDGGPASDIPKFDGDINDICLYGDNTILVSTSSPKLYLCDLETGKAVKSCVFPFPAGFMEFDGNVLYFASGGEISLSPGNLANFSNAAGGRSVGRLLINGEFPWPDSAGELAKWELDSLSIPFGGNAARHYAMSQSPRYLCFLDLLEGGGFTVYRIAK